MNTRSRILITFAMLALAGCAQSWGALDNPYDSRAIIQPPSIEVGSGSSPNLLTLSTSFPGAVVHYTFDGTTPTSSSTAYTQPVYLSPGIHTLKAVVSKAGYADSEVLRKSITVSATISTLAGSTASGYGGDGAAAKSALLNNPSALFVESNNLLLFNDQNNGRIRRIDLTSGTIDTYSGGGVLNPDGAFGPGIGWGPGQVLVDAGADYYVADGSRVFRINKQTQIFTRIAGPDGGNQGFAGDGGPATSAQFKGISGVAVNASGTIWICDNGNHRVRKIDTNGIVTTVAGNGVAGYAGDGGPAANSQVSSPSGALTDDDGSLLFCDQGNRRLRRIDASGIISTVADFNWHDGAPDVNQTSWGLSLNNNALDAPMTLVRGPQGDIYLALSWGNRVVQWNRAENALNVVVNKSGTNGYAGDGGDALSAQIQNVWGIGFDSLGRMYVGDSGNNVIRCVDPSAATAYPVASPTFVVDGATVNSAYTSGVPFVLNLATSTPGASVKYQFSGLATSTASTAYTTGLSVSLGTHYVSGIALVGDVSSPPSQIRLKVDPVVKSFTALGLTNGDNSGLVSDSDGNLYISDTVGGRVLKIPAGSSLSVTPTVIKSALSSPRELALDGTNLYVIVDQAVEKIDLASANALTLVAGSVGSGGFSDASGASARFQDPRGLTVQPGTHDLFVADTGNNRIRRIHGTAVTTVAGTDLSGPAGGAFAPNGDYWFINNGNGGLLRVLDVSAGTVRTISGLGKANSDSNTFHSPAGMPLSFANIAYSSSMVMDNSGNAVISCYSCGLVFYNAASDLLFPLTSEASQGYAGDNGAISAAKFWEVRGLAFGPAHQLYIYDVNGGAARLRVAQ